MKSILLIRHGKAEGYSEKDFERKLVKKGEADSLVTGHFLASQGIYPRILISSDAPRALETAGNIILAYEKAKKHVELVVDRNLYSGEMKDYVAAVSSLPDTLENVAVVGHNPCLEEMISFLCTGVDNFAFGKSSVFLMYFQPDSWKQISEKSCSFAMSSTAGNARDFYTFRSVKDMFKNRKEKFCSLFDKVAKNPSEKNIHDLRVEARWWKENFKTFESLNQSGKPGLKFKKTGNVLRITGKTRDLQNQYRWIRDNSEYGGLKKIWKRELNSSMKKTVSDFCLSDLRKTIGEIEKNIYKTEDLCVNYYKNGNFSDILDNWIFELRDKIKVFESLEDMHEFRLWVKKLRYLAEFKEEIDGYFDIYGKNEKRRAESLKSISSDIGEITDLNVFINTARNFLKKKKWKRHHSEISELIDSLTKKRDSLMAEFKSKIAVEVDLIL